MGVSFVHYKFQTEKQYQSLPIQGNFIRLGELKELIFKTRFGDRRKGVQLLVSNAQSGESYLKDNTDLIMRNTSLVVRRLPIQCLLAIVADSSGIKPKKSSTPITPPPLDQAPVVDLDDFGDDPFAAPQPALDTYMQEATAGGQGCESNGLLGYEERSRSPQGYVCHRCGIPGHLIQQCPTNADTMYNKKTGIKPSAAVAVSVSNRDEAAFDRFLDGISSSSSSSSRTSSVGRLPPELYCPLCRQVMKDAVIASKCCFGSFCDRCIRSQLMSNSACVCKAATTRPDNLLPNMTLRDTIARLLESKPNSRTSGSSRTGAEHQLPSADLKQHKLHPRSSLDAFQGGQHHKRQKSSFPVPNCYNTPAMSHASGHYNRPVWSVLPRGRFWEQPNSISVV